MLSTDDRNRGPSRGLSSRIREHLRSNVVGYIALFVALTGGTAYALDGSNTVFTDDIVNGEVQTPDLANDAVRGAKIEDGQVTGADLAGNSVGTPKIIDGGVRNADLGADAVDGSKVVDGSITGGDIDESSLGTVPQATNASTLDGVDSTGFGVGIMGGRMNAVTAAESFNRPPTGLSTGSGSFVAPGAGSFVARDLRISLTATLAAGQTRTFAFVKAGAATALGCTVPAGQAFCANTTDAVAVSSGTQYAIKQSGSTGAPPNVDVQFGWRAVAQ
jgi:hypothetical protein